MSLVYLPIKNNKGRTLPIMGIRRPPRPGHDVFKRDKSTLIGVSSCRGFPTGHEWIMNNVSGWCHCFRDPAKYGISGIPTALISESDFMGVNGINHDVKKRRDFIWACKGTNTQKTSKNAALLERCLPVMRDMGLSGYVVGFTREDLPSEFGPNISFISKQSWSKLMKKAAQCRFAFFPNLMDASPRFMGEVLSMNIPVIVNKDIYGGWKYVNENTGQFFSSENDVRESIEKLYDNHKILSPKEWWYDNYGPRHASVSLGSFISKIRPDLDVHRARFA